ncbi:GA45G protein, partial [Polypterus senegalus]
MYAGVKALRRLKAELRVSTLLSDSAAPSPSGVRVGSAGTNRSCALQGPRSCHTWMQCAGKALEEMLISAKHQECLTVGVYESAKVMNVNPDSVAFCVLVTDKEYECNIALQIHFTLIQAFCFDNDIDIVRVNDLQHMAKIIGCPGMPCDLQDMHCVLVTDAVCRQSTRGTAALCKKPRLDPDSVAFCVLATDEEYECDIALQIHFTLIQAFCFDNDINIVRVNDTQRLAEIVGSTDESGEPKDVHCILITVLGRVVRSSSSGASVGEENFTDFDFADDAVIFTESMEALIGTLLPP